MALEIKSANLAQMLASMPPDTPPKKVVAGNPQLFYMEKFYVILYG